MKNVLTKTLFILLFLPIVSSAIQAQGKEIGPADQLLHSIQHKCEETKLEGNKIIKELGVKNPDTAYWIKENPHATLGLAVAAIVVPICIARISYVATKKLLTCSYHKAQGDRDQ